MRAAKLKSLVWREWRVGRKQFYVFIVTLLVLCAFFWLFRLSMSVGNLAPVFSDDESMMSGFSSILYFLGSALVGVMATGVGFASENVWLADINANWLPYSYVLPISARERTAARYVIKLGELAVGICLAVINGIITAKITGMQFTGHMILLFLACASATIWYDAVQQFFMLRARMASEVQWAGFKSSMIVALIAMFFIAIKGQTDPSFFDNVYMDDIVTKMMNEFISHEHIIIPLVIFSFAVMLPLGFYNSCKAVEHYGDVKREKAEAKKSGLLFGRKKIAEGEEDVA